MAFNSGLRKKKSAYEQHVTATLDNTPYITINSLLEWEQNTWNNSYIFRKKKSQNYIFSSVQNKMLHGWKNPTVESKGPFESQLWNLLETSFLTKLLDLSPPKFSHL